MTSCPQRRRLEQATLRLPVQHEQNHHVTAPTHLKSNRSLGTLLLVQLLLGLSVNLGLMGRIVAQPGGFLAHAGAHPHLAGLAAVLGIGGGLLMLAVTLCATSGIEERSSFLSRWIQALGIVCVTLTAFEAATILGLVSFSQAHAAASGADQAALGLAEVIVRKTRSWAHLTNILFGALTFLCLYALLGQRGSIPKGLAWFGACAAALQMGTMLSPMLGFGYQLAFIAPAALAHLALAIWLVSKR